MCFPGLDNWSLIVQVFPGPVGTLYVFEASSILVVGVKLFVSLIFCLHCEVNLLNLTYTGFLTSAIIKLKYAAHTSECNIMHPG